MASGEIFILGSLDSKKWSSRVPEARLWIHQPRIQLHVWCQSFEKANFFEVPVERKEVFSNSGMKWSNN